MTLTYANIARTLDREGRTDEAIEFLEGAGSGANDSASLNLLGLLYGKKGLYREAARAFKRAIEADPSSPAARINLDRLYSKAIPSRHFSMMNDPARNEAFDRAIGKAVKETTYVLQIGAGPGLLAMMAARAGAGHVFACEENPLMAEKAIQTISRNGFADRVTVISAGAADLKVGIDLPRRMDLLVTGAFDAGLLGEGVLPLVDYAKRHLLVENAPIIPRGATLFACLAESDELRAMTAAGRVCGFDLGVFNEFSALSCRTMDFERVKHRPLTLPFEVFSFSFVETLEMERETPISVVVTDEGFCHGVLLWFRLRLDDEYVIDTSVGGLSKSWGQAVQTFPRPLRLGRGDEVTLLARHLPSLVLLEPLFLRQGEQGRG